MMTTETQNNDLEALDPLEAEIARVSQPSMFGISPRLLMTALAGAMGLGILIGSADIKIDPTVTFDTKLGQRTQPYWLAPKGAKIVKTEGSSLGFVRAFGWFGLAIPGAGLLWHVASKDRRKQEYIGKLATEHNRIKVKKLTTFGELTAMAEVQKIQGQLELQANLDQAEFNWQFQNAIGYDPLADHQFQPALPYGEPGTYDDINYPGDKVATSQTQGQIGDQKPIMPPLTNYPVSLIFGAPGGGKTTFADKVVKKKVEAGHRVIILDPHYKLGAWEGCEVFGKGMNYEEIDRELLEFCEEVKRRYKRLATELNPVFEPLSIIADEFTMWGKRCKNAGTFLWQIVTDIRKVNCFATIVGHTNTLAGLGGKDAAGAAKLILQAILEIEIMAKQDPDSGLAVPAFEAFVKLPGMKRKDAFSVRIEPDTEKSVPSSYDKSNSVLVADKPDLELEDFWGEADDAEPSEPPSERGSGRLTAEKTYTSRNLSKTDAIALVRDTLNTKNKTETIEALWGCKKGGSAAYQEAKAQFDELVSESG